MIDLELVYSVSLKKLHNFHRESDGLRKLVLLNNFVFKKFVSPQQSQEEEQIEPLEWSEEDVKKDEESWLDSCLNDLDEEDEDGYIYVNIPSNYQSNVASFSINCYDDSRHYEDHYIQNNNEMDYEQQPHEHKDDKVIDDVIIPHDLLHLPFFEPPGEGGPYHMDVEDDVKPSSNINTLNDSSLQHDYDVNMTEADDDSENLSCEKGFHPYWKDNSIIAPSISPLKKSSPFRPYFEINTRSFGIPKIFHKYRLGQDYSPLHIVPPFIRKLLQSDNSYQSLESSHCNSPSRRSKDDLDILYSLAPRDIDKGALMDMISMLEYYGCKTSNNNDKKDSNSSDSDLWFLDNE